MKTEKLELAHLAAYLPYGLKVHYEHPYIPHNGIWLLTGIIPNGLNIEREDESKFVSIEEIKPLLRPLSELNTIMKWDDGEYMMTDEDISNFNACPIDVWSYDFVIDCISKHFDVFGLIDKSLALPLTIQNNS